MWAYDLLLSLLGWRWLGAGDWRPAGVVASWTMLPWYKWMGCTGVVDAPPWLCIKLVRCTYGTYGFWTGDVMVWLLWLVDGKLVWRIWLAMMLPGETGFGTSTMITPHAIHWWCGVGYRAHLYRTNKINVKVGCRWAQWGIKLLWYYWQWVGLWAAVLGWHVLVENEHVLFVDPYALFVSEHMHFVWWFTMGVYVGHESMCAECKLIVIDSE